jgi:hypothetical protein
VVSKSVSKPISTHAHSSGLGTEKVLTIQKYYSAEELIDSLQ